MPGHQSPVARIGDYPDSVWIIVPILNYPDGVWAMWRASDSSVSVGRIAGQSNSQTLSGNLGGVSVAALDVAQVVKLRSDEPSCRQCFKIQFSLDYPDMVWPMSQYNKDFSDSV